MPGTRDPLFGELLRRHRLAAELTQEALAERAGLSVRGISDLERGVRSAPRIETVHLLCDGLGLSGSDRAGFVAAARTHGVTPPIRSRTWLPVAALPLQPNPLIGRDHDLANVRQRFLRSDVRLLTLTGPAGTGKTRLAVAVAASLVEQFEDGAVLVELAPLSDPGLVVVKIAQSLGIADVVDRPLMAQVHQYLQGKNLLLVLDNFEHVLNAAPHVAAILESCAHVKVLATSRVALHVRWEHEYAVPPLGLPDLANPLDLDVFGTSPALALFVQRAQAVNRHFLLTEANARTIGELCVHLDGLPLAIELAAARMKTLLPHDLLARLRQRFDLLVTGAADLPPRQRSLRAALDWSYHLLLPEEQALFRRLAVFAGGWTLTSAESVCAGDTIAPEAVAVLLARLVDASLVVVEQHVDSDPEETRYRFLESLRHYAEEKLGQAGRTALLRRRHADAFLTVAERAELGLRGPLQVLSMNRLEMDEDNFRVALDWSLAAPEHGLRLASALGWFWFIRGRASEGLAWLERLLEADRGRDTPAAIRAKALNAAGFLAHDLRQFDAARGFYEESQALAHQRNDPHMLATVLGRLGYLSVHQRDFEGARESLAQSLRLYRELGDRWGTAFVLNTQGLLARRQADNGTAERLYEESLYMFRACGDTWGISWAYLGLAQVSFGRGDYALATTLWRERLDLSRELKHPHGMAYSLDYLATAARMMGDYERSAVLFEQSLAIYRDIGDNLPIAWTLHAMGDLALEQGDTTRARLLYADGLTLRIELGDVSTIATSLEGFSGLAAAHHQPWQALRLAGAAAALQRATSTPPTLTESTTLDRWLAPARRALSQGEAESAFAEGAAMSREEALQCARALLGPAPLGEHLAAEAPTKQR